MRRTKWTGVLCTLLALVLLVPMTVTALAHEYDGKTLYDQEYPVRLNEGETLRERQRSMGGAEFDVDAYIDSEMGEVLIDYLLNYYTYEDEMHADVLAYWSSRGIAKTMHDGQDADNKWFAYVPSGLDLSGSSSYPVLFVLHGAGSPAFMAETYGYVQLAEQEDMIVVIPQNVESDAIMKVLRQVRQQYPVDDSRIYAAGFSMGGIMAGKVALENPTVFAAVHIGGGSMSLGDMPHEAMLADEELRNQMAFVRASIQIPVVTSSGMQDRNLGFPLNVQSRDENMTGDVKISHLNVWQAINGCSITSINESLSLTRESSNVVKRKIGIDLDTTEVKQLYGTDFYIGGQYDASGVEIMQFIGVENAPHTCVPGMAELSWAYMKQFSRDTTTGAVVVS